jgi:methylphosphotriester-DNA--protein-cysteine methyltransferase
MLGRRIPLSGIPPHAGADHVDALQQFLLARLANAHVDGVVAKALAEIQQARGCVRVAAIAAACGVSERHLNRLMRVWIGYGAKRLARIVRFQTTLHQMEHAPSRSGAILAADTGYFDQAHLTAEMANLAGATPGKLKTSHVADFYKTRCDRPL